MCSILSTIFENFIIFALVSQPLLCSNSSVLTGDPAKVIPPTLGPVCMYDLTVL